MRQKFPKWEKDDFKKHFKVGDLIWGPVSVVGRISAIGHKRFLFTQTRNTGEPYEVTDERVGSMENQSGWKKIKKEDEIYGYKNDK